MFKKLKSKKVYQNRWMEVFEDEIEFPDGHRGIYGYVKRSNGAGCLVTNAKSEVLLIKQYRYPIGKYEWNLPGGAIDKDTPHQAVVRELEEETGLKIKGVESLGKFYPLSSCSSEKVYVFWGKTDDESKMGNHAGESDESIEQMEFVDLEKALIMIDRGEITDAMTCNAIQILARKLKE